VSRGNLGGYREGVDIMAKGQQKPKTNNKPKLTAKEKKQKKKDKAAAAK
jgi:hypothetical protein